VTPEQLQLVADIDEFMANCQPGMPVQRSVDIRTLLKRARTEILILADELEAKNP